MNVSERAGRRNLRPASFLLALGVAAAAYLVLAWLVLVSVPRVDVSLGQLETGEWVVASIPVSESAWLAGVRPGMRVEGISPDGDSQQWESLLVSDGSKLVTIQRTPQPPEIPVMLTGLLALVLAAGVHRLAPGLAWWLLVVPALSSLAVASDLVSAPTAFGLTLAAPTIGALDVTTQSAGLRRVALGAAAVGLASAAWLVAYVVQFESWALPRQLSAGIAVGLLAFGSAASVRQAWWRARTRLARNGAAAMSSLALFAATVDELIPGRNRSRLLAIESERARLATDLHADVLPVLADVIRLADAGTNPTQTASRLREVADEIRDLMAERRLAVLEELGLVAALEWLAERIEERADLRVEIEIHGDDVHRAPREVELVAFRIAQQSIDNVLVHAHADTIRIDLAVSAQRLELDVSDDGRGVPADAEARALRGGHLGLADMRARAAAIGGTFQIGRRPGNGTIAMLRWPA